MNAWLSLDFVAKRYGKLPSEVLIVGDDLDLRCAELAVEYETYLNNKNDPTKPPGHNLSQEQMKAMIESVKNKTKDKK